MNYRGAMHHADDRRRRVLRLASVRVALSRANVLTMSISARAQFVLPLSFLIVALL